MSIHKRRTKINVYQPSASPTYSDRIKEECAKYIQPYSTHQAGGGSYYVYAGDVKIRFANHSGYSQHHGAPDFNIVNKKLDTETLAEIIDSIGYPYSVKKTVFARHIGITVPKLKKLLEPPYDKLDIPSLFQVSYYDEICENPRYPDTYTNYVIVDEALEVANAAGITARIPIAFGIATLEDYDGRCLCS